MERDTYCPRCISDEELSTFPAAGSLLRPIPKRCDSCNAATPARPIASWYLSEDEDDGEEN